MRALKFLSLGLLFVAVPVSNLQAQGTRADYRRSAELRKRFSGKVFRDRIRLKWFADDQGGWYRVDLGGGKREFVLVDVRRRKRRAAFDHKDLAEALTKATGKAFDSEKLPLEGLRFSADRKHCWFRAAGKGWLCERDDSKLQEAEEPKNFDAGSDRQPADWKRPGFESPRNRRSPDGVWEVFVKEHDLHLRNRRTGSELRLSGGGDQERSWSDNVFWSPDSKRLVAYRTRRGAKHTVHMVESSPQKQLQPKLHSHQYLKPGDKIPLTRPHLYDVSSGREIPVSNKLFSNPWRVRELRWNKAGDRFTFRYNQRGHQVLRLIEVNARSGAVRAVIEETSNTFLDYA